MTERLLIVDDDRTILRTLRITLRARGYEIEAVTNGADALSSVAETAPDLVVLDLGLPDLDGIEVLRRIRRSSAVPVVVLSARHESEDKVEALDEGADDFVTKPFGSEELLARVRAALRRSGPRLDTTDAVHTDDFSLDFATYTARTPAGPVHLTPTEWRFVATLAAHRGQVVPRAALLHAVWGPAYGAESNYLRVYVNQLRRKLEPEPSRPRHLITEPGIGYLLR